MLGSATSLVGQSVGVPARRCAGGFRCAAAVDDRNSPGLPHSHGRWPAQGEIDDDCVGRFLGGQAREQLIVVCVPRYVVRDRWPNHHTAGSSDRDQHVADLVNPIEEVGVDVPTALSSPPILNESPSHQLSLTLSAVDDGLVSTGPVIHHPRSACWCRSRPRSGSTTASTASPECKARPIAGDSTRLQNAPRPGNRSNPSPGTGWTTQPSWSGSRNPATQVRRHRIGGLLDRASPPRCGTVRPPRPREQ